MKIFLFAFVSNFSFLRLPLPLVVTEEEKQIESFYNNLHTCMSNMNSSGRSVSSGSVGCCEFSSRKKIPCCGRADVLVLCVKRARRKARKFDGEKPPKQ